MAMLYRVAGCQGTETAASVSGAETTHLRDVIPPDGLLCIILTVMLDLARPLDRTMIESAAAANIIRITGRGSHVMRHVAGAGPAACHKACTAIPLEGRGPSHRMAQSDALPRLTG